MVLANWRVAACVVGMLSTGALASVATPKASADDVARADELVEEASKTIPHLKPLLGELRGPEDHDRATAALKLDASLVNLHFASQFETPLGKALYMPIQISKREGGRSSLYYIAPGQQVRVGVFIINSDIYYRVVRRDSGRAIPAATGDTFSELMQSPDGRTVAEMKGQLRVLDFSRGIGELRFASQPDRVAASWVWYAWSFIATGSDK